MIDHPGLCDGIQGVMHAVQALKSLGDLWKMNYAWIDRIRCNETEEASLEDVGM